MIQREVGVGQLTPSLQSKTEDEMGCPLQRPKETQNGRDCFVRLAGSGCSRMALRLKASHLTHLGEKGKSIHTPSMRHLWQLISLVLLTTWLPATQFCNLASSGLIVKHHSTGGIPGGGSAIHGCELVKNTDPQCGNHDIKAAGPAAGSCGCLLCLPTYPLEIDFADTALAAQPRECHPKWVTNWRFVQRAALPPRAPTPLFA